MKTKINILELPNSVADPDPGSGAFLTPWIRIRDPGWGKNPDQDGKIGILEPE